MSVFKSCLIGWSLCALVAGCVAEVGTSDDAVVSRAALQTSSIAFDVALRGTGTASIHASVYTNTAIRRGDTVLAVHGLFETGTTFEPLAEAVFADRALRRRIKRVVAIDMTGHGESGFPISLPEGARFGELTIEDNVAVVLQSIEALRRLRMGPATLIGHSMGGLESQAAQQTLLTQGSSLARRGVRHVVLLAPVPPHGRPWMQPPPSDLSSLVVQDPVLGAYVTLPPFIWVAQAYTTRAGVSVAGAPTPEDVEANGYSGPEPLTVLLQLTESPIALPSGETIVIPRPTVEAGAFAPRHGTRLSLVSFAEDTLVPAPDLADLYQYLTGDTRGRGYHAVTTEDSVHSMFLSNPEGLLAALRER
jgi:pimeloyl-ACP methyl ester carboxylesterase